jgi:hypothetical protein
MNNQRSEKRRIYRTQPVDSPAAKASRPAESSKKKTS